MLTGLRIQNFKSWRDSGAIRLAPVTVLFGANSSGKTSLIQLLLLLKQSAANTDRRRVLDLGDANSLVELGTFNDLVHNHRAADSLSFTISWTGERTDVLEGFILLDDYYAPLHFDTKIIQAPDGPLAVDNFGYSIANEYFSVNRNGPDSYCLHSVSHSERHNLGTPTKFYGFPELDDIPPTEINALGGLEYELERALAKISYVGPMRENPRRSYLWTGTVPSDVGKKGERAVEALLAAQITAGSVAGPGRAGNGASLPEQVGRWLRDMKVVHSFELRELVAGRQIFELVVRARPGSPEVLLTDVGFGVSQVLPVLVQSYYAERSGTVIFEQPEIHLHPSVQSQLADVFIDAARTQGVQFLIESHSEHLLRRLQRRLAEGVVTAGDVALYFVEYGPDGSVLRELELDETGNIRNWPDGFFGDDFSDIATVARLSAEHRLRTARGGTDA